MWIRTLGMGAFLWGLFMMMGDITAIVQYFGYPSESRNVASFGAGPKPPDRRAAADRLESMFVGFPGKLVPMAETLKAKA